MSYSKYTTYNALVEKSVVCQGYASAMYRQLRELNVGVRFITGLANGGGHVWNIAKINDVWYNLDATWDAGNPFMHGTIRYFLNNQRDFIGHIRDRYYDTDEFHEKYPMAETPITRTKLFI